jgi:thiol-disulfide isomerase/thioredoxin
MIIDCHGHYTTAPEPHNVWREAQKANFKSGGDVDPAYPDISDDEIRVSIEQNQLRLIKQRGADLTVFSPRASTMAHHVGNEDVSKAWTRRCNDLIKRVVDLFPEYFIGVCQLPQSPGVDIAHSIAELDQALQQARERGQRAMLDFYADWCVSCKEMEARTFSDAEIRAHLLAGYVLLKADVTANSADDQALLKRFGIFGPPTTAFFATDGHERTNARLVGFIPADGFRAHLQAFESTP